MKVLHFITTTELGGAQKVCIDLCEKAVKEDFQVAVASMKGGYLWSMLAPEVIPLPLNFLQKNIKLSRDFLVFFELIQIMKEFKPDILHLHSSKAGVLGRLVGMFFKTKIVYTVHGFDSIRKKYNYFLPLERLLQKHCDAIIPVSFYDKKNLEKERITKNLTVIQNGCMENTNKTTHPYLESLKNSNQKIIMTIARLAASKLFKQKKVKIIYTAHGFHFYKGAPLLNWLLYYPVEKFLLRYTDVLIDYLVTKRPIAITKRFIKNYKRGLITESAEILNSFYSINNPENFTYFIKNFNLIKPLDNDFYSKYNVQAIQRNISSKSILEFLHL